MANNTTYNLTDEGDDEQYAISRLSFIIVAILIMVVAVFGNILTIVAVFKEYHLRKLGNSFIVSLAVTDLLLAVIVIPLFVVDELEHVVLGDILCAVHGNFDIMLSTVSILNITCISIDRYIAITDPLHYSTRMTRKVAGSLISCTWLVPGILFTLYYFLGIPFAHMENKKCSVILFGMMHLIFLVWTWFVPTLMMLVAYGVIFRVARKHEAQVTELRQISHNLNNAQPVSQQRSHKAAKTLGLITGVFMICWMPSYASAILVNISPHRVVQTPGAVWHIVEILSYASSMINPVIYAVFNQSFQKAFKKLLCRA